MEGLSIGSSEDLFEEGLLSVQEASKYLSISKSKLYSLMDAGELPYVKIGKARRIPKRALIGLAQSNLRGGWKVINDKGLRGGAGDISHG